MDVVTDVALLADEAALPCGRLPARGSADRTESIREVRRCSHGTGRRREREEKSVTLRVHLDAAVVGACFAYQCTVIGERVRVCLRAELVQQRRRAFDVGEDKRDGAGRKLGSHDGIIRRSRQPGKTPASSDIPAH